MDEITQQKHDARTSASRRRNEIHARMADAARTALANNALEFLNLAPGSTVSGFLPFRSEVDVTGLLAVLADAGMITALPVVTGNHKPLQFRVWRQGDALESGAFGIDVPKSSAATVQPDVLLVPLLAFDKTGYRLGYGGGFYDRTIAELRQTGGVISVGVAFSEQQVEHVVRGPYDQPVDWILTEQGALKCG